MSQHTTTPTTANIDRLFSHRRSGRAMAFLCAANSADYGELLRLVTRSHLGRNRIDGTFDGNKAFCLVAWAATRAKEQELRDLATYWAKQRGQSHVLFASATGRVQEIALSGRSVANGVRPALTREGIETYFSALGGRTFTLEAIGEDVFPHYGDFATSFLCHQWDETYAKLGREAFAHEEQRHESDSPEWARGGYTGGTGEARREGSLEDVLEHGSSTFVFKAPDGHKYELGVWGLRKPGGSLAQDEFRVHLWKCGTTFNFRREWKRCALPFARLGELVAQCEAGDISIGRLGRELDKSWGSHATYLAERKELEPLAAKGDCEAIYRLSSLIRQHAPEDRAWVDYLRTSALEHGNAAAQFRLARAYEKGDIKDSRITKSDVLALYKKAARQGHERARRVLNLVKK